MTVKELIEKLQTLPLAAPVAIFDYEICNFVFEIDNVRVIERYQKCSKCNHDLKDAPKELFVGIKSDISEIPYDS